MLAHALGWPRIGPNREWKKALEGFWKGKLDETALADRERELRALHLRQQIDAGLDVLTLDFARYDPVHEVLVALGRPPKRFADLSDRFYSLARGKDAVPALALRKWFGTNYHYLVPEWDAAGNVWPEDFSFFVRQIHEARSITAKPLKVAVPGPATLRFGGSIAAGVDEGELDRALGESYARLATAMHQAGADWVQWDEPWFVLGERRDESVLRLYEPLRSTLAPQIGSCPYGRVDDQMDLLTRLPWQGLHLDAVESDPEAVRAAAEAWPLDRVLSIGALDGRSPWAETTHDVSSRLEAAGLKRTADKRRPELVWLGSSCSLAHLPYDLDAEKKIPETLRPRLAFALQKAGLVAEMAHRIVAERVSDPSFATGGSPGYALQADKTSPAFDWKRRPGPRSLRRQVQAKVLELPPFPTTTIGSFPQTEDLRRDRLAWTEGRMSDADYRSSLEERTRSCVLEQEKIGLDVLVHGEFERTDMVEYFAQNLEGMLVTDHGWVQSYGSRCVRPPLIVGPVRRSRSLTEGWLEFAQSLTKKPVKAMLTGPLTILKWSFPRPDASRETQARELAQAVADELSSLQDAGLKVVQVDEPGFREGLPLRGAEQEAYWKWAVAAFNHAVAPALTQTQVHTHMCYADFGGLWSRIDALDADVISLEASRGGAGWTAHWTSKAADWGVGLGVWDVHSPEVPSEKIMADVPREASRHIDAAVWVNPDCGLKTRGWTETRAGLRNLVEAAEKLRREIAPS